MKDVWLIAGTRLKDEYPCRCHEAKYGRCHPAFCPCSGRLDYGPGCCARVNTPERAAMAQAAYELRRRRERGTSEDD